jgi:hypothetical protein
MNSRIAFVALSLAALPACANAKPAATAKGAARKSIEDRRVYRLDFVVSSRQPGKPDSSSAHTMSVEEMTPGEVRVGSNVQLASHARQDVGLLIRATATPVADDLMLDHAIELSSIDDAAAIRKMTMRGDTIVSPGTPVVVASAEDPIGHGRVDVTVTATRLR